MTVNRYRTFDDARKSQWNFRPDEAYYRKLRDLFGFFDRTRNAEQKSRGVHRYLSLQEASDQEIAWKVMSAGEKYQEKIKKSTRRQDRKITR